MPRLYFLEPSKVGSQHITLLDGYLRAIFRSNPLRAVFEIVVCTSRRTWLCLDLAAFKVGRWEQVPVMDPEKRRLVLKSLLEFAVVLRYIMRMRKGDILFVTCLLPPALILVELARRCFRKGRVLVTLHGEIEGLFDLQRQGVSSYGFWVCKWMRIRSSNSRLELVVIDDFIRDRLLSEFPKRLFAEGIHVIHHPIQPTVRLPVIDAPFQRACFIGYKTRYKGYEYFDRLARLSVDTQFVCIGGGKIETVAGGESVSIEGSKDYLDAIGDCAVAVFPYTGGYTCSLSAAALDALSAGVHIVAFERPFFASLDRYFGEDFLTIAKDAEDLARICLDADRLKLWMRGASGRVRNLAESRYGLAAVACAFERAAGIGRSDMAGWA